MKAHDPMGQAVYDYYFKKDPHFLLVIDKFGPPTPMDASYYFREYKWMPKLEKEALRHCDGKILDVGAGAGSHALYLQKHKLAIHCLDISEKNCEVMKARGLEYVYHASIWDFDVSSFDTLLFMMNGIGFVETIEGLKKLLLQLHEQCKDKVQLIFDSSDVYYMYETRPLPTEGYYGEIPCRYEYGEMLSPWFKWLYIDDVTMRLIAKECGWKFEILDRDTDKQYLARLTKKH